jgi:hypothetical protein
MTRITGGPRFSGDRKKTRAAGRDDGSPKDRRPDAGLIDGGSGIAVKRRLGGSIAYLGSTLWKHDYALRVDAPGGMFAVCSCPSETA